MRAASARARRESRKRAIWIQREALPGLSANSFKILIGIGFGDLGKITPFELVEARLDMRAQSPQLERIFPSLLLKHTHHGLPHSRSGIHLPG